MIDMLLTIFFVAFFLNLLYEVLHSGLYTTCLEASFKKYQYLMLKASLFDGLAISLIYFIASLISQKYEIIIFILISLVFAYSWEIYSLKKKKWEYANTMPKIFGAGITPTIQLALTGVISIYIVMNFFV